MDHFLRGVLKGLGVYALGVLVFGLYILEPFGKFSEFRRYRTFGNGLAWWFAFVVAGLWPYMILGLPRSLLQNWRFRRDLKAGKYAHGIPLHELKLADPRDAERLKDDIERSRAAAEKKDA